MRKVMLLAAMLAMVLAAAAPVFAQDDITITQGDDVEYNAVCQNIIGAIGDITQDQTGDADATAVDDSAAVAEVAQEQGVTVDQVNACLNNFATVTATATATATATVSGGGGGGGGAAAAVTVLPETGGASLFALGAGALLVAGGLLARRIVR